MNIIDTIKSLPDYVGSTGRTSEEINECENALGLKFSSDYREYLSKIGLASFDGRELTGISKYDRLNVVSVTKDDREYLPDIPSNLYVIEESGIDGIIIWQSSDGTVYQSSMSGKITKISDSLEEYLLR